MKTWKHEYLEYDFVVCGGGLAGVCAAIAAARHGLRVGLLHDRTVLGGNSSSEVRVTPHGAAQHHPYARETGIISELLIEERCRNHAEIFENGWTNSIWDLVLLDAVYQEERIDLHLNTKVVSAYTQENSITHVEALVLDSETLLKVQGKLYLDATGDGIVAAEAGCSWMSGTEGQDVFGEPHAPKSSSDDTMGNSILFKTEDIGETRTWIPPAWAKQLRDEQFFYGSGRQPNDARGGFWWIELGIPRHTIYDNRTLRRDLQAYALGVWDWMKHHDRKMLDETRTRMLDWLGSVLGTRESRRIVGLSVMQEQDVQQRRVFDDEVAYGGWFLDLHTPGGLIAEHSEKNSAQNYNPFSDTAAQGFVGPYGIPLSCLTARDVNNLFLAGRNISASHTALGTMRVMGTTALMGQAVGTAAAVLMKYACTPHAVTAEYIQEIQQNLLRDGVWLPNVVSKDLCDIAASAEVSADSEDVFTRVEPDQKGWAEQQGIIDLRINESFLNRVDTRMVQLIASDGSLRSVSICISNHSSEVQQAKLLLHRCRGLYDYEVKDDEHALSHTLLDVPPGMKQWIVWDIPESAIIPGSFKKPKYVRVELQKNENLQWHQAKTCFPGHPAYFEFGMKKIRKLQHGISLACAVSPSQKVFSPQNVISGVSRHHDSVHLWRSDPNQEFPVRFYLKWPDAQAIQRIDLTFPGNLLRSYHAYRPFYRAPETARDYRVILKHRGETAAEIEITDNYQRRREHLFETPCTADEAVIEILSTNGDPAAGLFDVRVYGPKVMNT